MENEMNEQKEPKTSLMSDVENLAKAEYEVARLRVIENVSRMVGFLLLAICLILVVFAVLSFCAAAAVFALAQYMPAWAACLVIGALYLVAIPILIIGSKQLFVNPIIRKMSGLKNYAELKYEALRAEGQAAIMKERINSGVRLAEMIINYGSMLMQTAWNTILHLFSKKEN